MTPAPRLTASARTAGDAGAGPLLLVAAMALGLGLLVYLVDRGTAQSQALQAVSLPPLGAGQRLFGSLGLWLPSLVHPLAFGLFTAAVLRRRPRPAYGACVTWCAIDIVFELGQHPLIRGALAGALDGVGQVSRSTALTRPLADYFVRGTFDGGDIVAIVVGSLVAAALLRWFHRGRETDHEIQRDPVLGRRMALHGAGRHRRGGPAGHRRQRRRGWRRT